MARGRNGKKVHAAEVERFEGRRMLAGTATVTSLDVWKDAGGRRLELRAQVTPIEATGSVAFVRMGDAGGRGTADWPDPYEVRVQDAAGQVSGPARLIGVLPVIPGGRAAQGMDANLRTDGVVAGEYRAVYFGSGEALKFAGEQVLGAEGVVLSAVAGETRTYLLLPQGHGLLVEGGKVTVEDESAEGAQLWDARKIAVNAGETQRFAAVWVGVWLTLGTDGSGVRYTHLQSSEPGGFDFLARPSGGYAASVSPGVQLETIVPVTGKTRLEVKVGQGGSYTNPAGLGVTVYDQSGLMLAEREAWVPQLGQVRAVTTGGGWHFPWGSGAGSMGTGGGLTTGATLTVGGAVKVHNATVGLAAAAVRSAQGTVSFYEGERLLGTETLGATGWTYWLPTPRSLAVGTHTIRVVYSGDFAYAGSEQVITGYTVARGETSVAVTKTALNPFDEIEVTVATAGPEWDDPTGTVSFWEGPTKLAEAPLGWHGPGLLRLTAGRHELTAIYSGDASFAGSSETVSVYQEPMWVSTGDGTFDPFTIKDDQLTAGVKVGAWNMAAVREITVWYYMMSESGSGSGNEYVTTDLGKFVHAWDGREGGMVELSADTMRLPTTPELAGKKKYILADLSFGWEGGRLGMTTVGWPEAVEYQPALPAQGAVGWGAVKAKVGVKGVAVKPGTAATATLGFSNPAAKAFKGAYTVSYYLSDDGNWSANDVKLSRQKVSVALAGRKGAMFQTAVKLPGTADAGGHYLVAVAKDAKGAEAFRVATPILVQAAKLTASVAGTTVKGKSTLVTFRVSNDGNAAATSLRLKVKRKENGKVLVNEARGVSVKAGKSVMVMVAVAGWPGEEAVKVWVG